MLVGHSYGGGVALSAASLAPDRVEAVILLASVGPGCVNGWDRLLAAPGAGPAVRAGGLAAHAVDRPGPAPLGASRRRPPAGPGEYVNWQVWGQAGRDRGPLWRTFLPEQRALLRELRELEQAVPSVQPPVLLLADPRDTADPGRYRPPAGRAAAGRAPAARRRRRSSPAQESPRGRGRCDRHVHGRGGGKRDVRAKPRRPRRREHRTSPIRVSRTRPAPPGAARQPEGNQVANTRHDHADGKSARRSGAPRPSCAPASTSPPNEPRGSGPRHAGGCWRRRVGHRRPGHRRGAGRGQADGYSARVPANRWRPPGSSGRSRPFRPAY